MGEMPVFPLGDGSTRFYPKSSFWHTSFQVGMVMDLALRVPADMMGGSAVRAVPGRQEQAEQSPRDLKGCI